MAESTYIFKFLAQTKEATDSVNKFSSTTQKHLDGIKFNTAVSAIRDGFSIVKGVADATFSAISGVISKSIDEANAAEEAYVKLANSLRLTGDFSEEAVSQFDELAKSLQKTTKFSDEQVFSAIAIAKQYRATNEEAKKLATVSADLAAFLGVDLDTAATQLGRTLNGFVDRSLLKAIPQIKALSKESLIAGDALDIVGKRVAGTAEAIGNTFSGRITKAQNAFSDLLETIGGLFTQNDSIKEGIKIITDAIVEFGDALNKNKGELKSIVTEGFILIVQSAPAIVNVIKVLDRVISTTVLSFVTLGRSIGAVGAAIAALANLDFDGIKEINAAVSADNAKSFEDNAKRINAFYTPLLDTTTKLADRISKVREKSDELNKSFKNQGPSNTGEQQRAIDAVTPEDAIKLAEKNRKRIEDVSKAPIEQLIKLSFEGKLQSKDFAAAGIGIANQILKGAQGAQKAVSSAIGGIADLILPGIGGVVGEIVDVLGQGPEKVKEMVQGFVKALPEIIENIAEAFPVLIEEIAKTLPPALAKTMPTVAVSFSTELIKNIPNIVEGFAKGLLEAGEEFVNKILDIIPGGSSIGNAITGSDGGGLFGGDGFLGLGLGFAEGGQVPNNPKFEGDRFPARLNAGELVIDKDLTNRLDAFISNGNASTQPLIINLQVGETQLAQAILNLNRRGFRTTA